MAAGLGLAGGFDGLWPAGGGPDGLWPDGLGPAGGGFAG